MENSAGWSQDIHEQLREINNASELDTDDLGLVAASEDILGYAVEVSRKLDSLRLPRPSIFPTDEGSFRFEWLIQDKSHLSLDIKPDNLKPLVKFEVFFTTLGASQEAGFEFIYTAEAIRKCYELYNKLNT